LNPHWQRQRVKTVFPSVVSSTFFIGFPHAPQTPASGSPPTLAACAFRSARRACATAAGAGTYKIEVFVEEVGITEQGVAHDGRNRSACSLADVPDRELELARDPDHDPFLAGHVKSLLR